MDTLMSTQNIENLVQKNLNVHSWIKDLGNLVISTAPHNLTVYPSDRILLIHHRSDNALLNYVRLKYPY